MNLTFQYPIYPNQAQIRVLESNLRFECGLYNAALEERIRHYRHFGKGTTPTKQMAQLPEIKALFPKETSTIYAQSLQQTLRRLDHSYKAFFRRVKEGSESPGFPRFKSASRYRTVVFPQCDLAGGGGVKFVDDYHLQIFGIPGLVRIDLHRPYRGRCKQVRITRSGIGLWYVSLTCADVPVEPLAKTGRTIGIDLGLTNFITTDDGTQFHHPRPYRTAKEKLARLQQRLALKQRGSKNRRRAVSSLARASEKVANVRKDFQHRLALKLVRENDTIVHEDLNVKGMLEQKGRAVSKINVSDASWGNFIALLTYKAERAGRSVVAVNPRNTSKMCFGCGNIKQDLTLRDRWYYCQQCGFATDRDRNAALNIKRLGVSLAAATQVAASEIRLD